jgi:hypothetical protein
MDARGLRVLATVVLKKGISSTRMVLHSILFPSEGNAITLSKLLTGNKGLFPGKAMANRNESSIQESIL